MRAAVTFVLLLALAAVARGQGLTPAQVVSNIRTLTAKSQALQGPAQSISIINGPLIVIGQGPFPTIIQGFTEIVTIATTSIAQMQGSPRVTAPADATAIANAFREFVRVHQVLLNILIGKAGLFQTVPLIGAPVASVLRQVENVVDTIAFGLIDMLEGQGTDVMSQANSLSGTLGVAIKSYEGLQTR